MKNESEKYINIELWKLKKDLRDLNEKTIMSALQGSFLLALLGLLIFKAPITNNCVAALSVFFADVLGKGTCFFIKNHFTRKKYKSNKNKLLELKAKEEILTDKEYNEKYQVCDLKEVSARHTKEIKEEANFYSGIFLAVTFFGAVVTVVVNQNLAWIPIINGALYAASTAVETHFHIKHEKAKAEVINLSNETYVSGMREREIQKKKELEEEIKLEKSNSMGKNEEKVETIINALTDQNETVDEQSKKYIKK